MKITLDMEAANPDAPVELKIENLLATLRGTHNGDDFISNRFLVEQIEAQLPKPKPEEPTGLGAVVRDADGTYFVRVQTHHTSPWVRQGVVGNAALYRYADIPVIKVLSEGVDL